jgi:hypothetical protein
MPGAIMRMYGLLRAKQLPSPRNASIIKARKDKGMNTIQQTIDIPDDRRLRLDLAIPEDIPTGRAEMLVVFSSMPKDAPDAASRRLGCMRGLGVVDKELDIKSFGREEVTALFEGRG